MAKISFEVYTLKDGQWQVDCVFNEKQDAANEALRIYKAGRFDGVNVLQESYYEETNKATAKIVLNRLKSDENKPATPRQVRPNKHESRARVKAPTPKINSQKKSAATNKFGMAGITICVILLGMVGIAFYYLDKFKG